VGEFLKGRRLIDTGALYRISRGSLVVGTGSNGVYGVILRDMDVREYALVQQRDDVSMGKRALKLALGR
jgi:hypothetical protein